MSNFYKEKLKEIKVLLGMEVQMVEALLEDGVTRVEVEALEAGKKVFVVSEAGERAPAPEGTHVLEDGTKIDVDENGVIKVVTAPSAEEVEAKKEEEVKMSEVEVEISPEKEVEEMEEEPSEEDIKETLKKVVMAIEEITTEMGILKEEMGSYKSKEEVKMSKIPGASKIKSINTEAASTAGSIDERLDALKSLRKELNKK